MSSTIRPLLSPLHPRFLSLKTLWVIMPTHSYTPPAQPYTPPAHAPSAHPYTPHTSCRVLHIKNLQMHIFLPYEYHCFKASRELYAWQYISMRVLINPYSSWNNSTLRYKLAMLCMPLKRSDRRIDTLDPIVVALAAASNNAIPTRVQ